VPVGVAGELYVGGVQVARGYLNRPDLTAERFIPDGYGSREGGRLYKTGDLGRYLEDGNIEYLGRGDDQVKVRGYRIELGEIEAQLREHGEIKEAVVMVREDTPGDKRLVAYVTGMDEKGPNVEELRGHLKRVLPEYMVPSAFVVLGSLPLTPNGKLDRRALPAPGQDAYARQDYEAPEGEIEETLAKIWRELLSVDRIGRQDNFFDLGGHSLLATRVITHIRHILDVDIPLRAIFEKPTIEGLTDCIVQEIADEVSVEAT
jgi:arthrofactin-type cyclic lipopeptide synthetase C